jgi:hypothetical protein
MKAFYDNFSDVCQARGNDITLRLQGQCGEGQRVTGVIYRAKYCVLTQIGMSVAAQDFVISENSQMMFSNLEFDEQAAPIDLP